VPAVLGIDAAWTNDGTSGVALVAKEGNRWKLLAVEPSYEEFCSEGGLPVARILVAARELAGCDIDLVAVDMPLSRDVVTGRRVADNAVSHAFGAAGCGTHSPSRDRPGKIGEELTEGFRKLGYPLCTSQVSARSLIEVYPHPALIVLMKQEMRLPYKATKIRRYWPTSSPQDRRAKLLDVWNGIVDALERQISGVTIALPLPGIAAAERVPAKMLKAYEDQLDAVVCAWAGILVLEGRAKPFGDLDAAIWIPLPEKPMSLDSPKSLTSSHIG